MQTLWTLSFIVGTAFLISCAGRSSSSTFILQQQILLVIKILEGYLLLVHSLIKSTFGTTDSTTGEHSDQAYARSYSEPHTIQRINTEGVPIQSLLVIQILNGHYRTK